MAEPRWDQQRGQRGSGPGNAGLAGFDDGGAAARGQSEELVAACGGEAGMRNKPAAFNVPPAPPSAVWFKAEQLRRQVDTPVHVARETAEGEALAAGSGNLMALHAPIKGALSAIAAAGFNLSQTGPTNRQEVGGALLQRKWELYVHCLGGYGYTLDAEYQILDRNGRVVDTWWKDNLP